MPTYHSHTELDCFIKARDAKIWLIKFIQSLPKTEFDMKDNLIRAARSMTRNIAEGFGRFHYKDNIRFIRFARGSAFECIDDLDSCVIEGLCETEETTIGKEKIEKAIHSMNGYIKYLRSRTNS